MGRDDPLTHRFKYQASTPFLVGLFCVMVRRFGYPACSLELGVAPYRTKCVTTWLTNQRTACHKCFSFGDQNQPRFFAVPVFFYSSCSELRRGQASAIRQEFRTWSSPATARDIAYECRGILHHRGGTLQQRTNVVLDSGRRLPTNLHPYQRTDHADPGPVRGRFGSP